MNKLKTKKPYGFFYWLSGVKMNDAIITNGGALLL